MRMILCALVVFSSLLSAAEVGPLRRADGEPVPGRIVGVAREGLFLAGGPTARATWAELDIASVASAEPIPVWLANGDRVTARLVAVLEDKIVLEADLFGRIEVPRLALASFEAIESSSTRSADRGAAIERTIQDETAAAVAEVGILEPHEWKGKLAILGTVRAGNTESLLLSLRTEFARQWTENRFTSKFNASYGETEGELTASSIYGEAKFDHYYTKDFYAYANSSALFDEVADINLRALFGLGAGYNLWRGEQAADEYLDIEGGISAIYEDFANGGGGDIDPAVRLAFVYKNIVWEKVQLAQSFEFIAPMTELDAYIIRSVTSVSVPLADGWSLRNSLEVDYQGEPAPGADAMDLTLLIGIEYSF